MAIQLSDHFTYARLLRFMLPSMGMMLFSSIYGLVDGFFVSNCVDKTAFTAVNFIYPLDMVLGAAGFMFGAGGSALIAKTLGEGDREKACRIFTLFVLVSGCLGMVLAALGIVFIRPVAQMLGAEGQLLEDSVHYGRFLIYALPASMLQFQFQSYFVTAGKPQLGFWVTFAAGMSNIVLDWLLISVFEYGITGAAVATSMSEVVGGLFPLVYFSRANNTSLLRFMRPRWDWRAVCRSAANGSSEFLSTISISGIAMLYNWQLIREAGNDGVAAYGVVQDVSFFFEAVFLGYAVGVSPVVSFHYGAQNRQEVAGLLRKSLTLTGIFAVVLFLSAELLATPIARILVGYDATLMAMTERVFLLYSPTFLLTGIGIFGAAFFTALNNPLVSALIAFFRTLVFQVAAILVLPLFLGLDGIWLADVAAELLAALLVVSLLLYKRPTYGY